MKRMFATMALFAALPICAASYHIDRHIVIGGKGGWDYLRVDETHRRLFVSHGTEVEIVDLVTGKTDGKIDRLEGVHGIAIASDLGRGYISNGRSGLVTVFELSTLNRIKDWKTTGDNPDAILYDRASRRLLTFNGRGSNTTIFDAKSGRVVATIALDGRPEEAVSRGDGAVFINIEDKNEIVEVDAKNATIVRRWSIAPCDSPSGLAIDVRHERLFSVCENKLMVISDAKGGKVVTTVPIGAGTDGAAFDAKGQLAFSSNGADGTITVVHEVSPDKFEVVDTVTTARGARTMALDTTTRHLFVPTAKFGAPPAPTPDRPRPRPAIEPGTFEVIELAP